MLPSSVHQVAHEDEAFVDHRDEGIRAAAPSVAVGDLFEEVRFLVEGLAANLDVHTEVRAHVEWRIDVDELKPAGIFDLTAQRTALERRKNELVVAPDEFVGPAFELAAARVEQVFLSHGLWSIGLFLFAVRRCVPASEKEGWRSRLRGSCRSRQVRLRACLRTGGNDISRAEACPLDEPDEVALLSIREFVFFGFVVVALD